MMNTIQDFSSDGSDDEKDDTNYFEPQKEDPKKHKRFNYTKTSWIEKTNVARSKDFEASPPIIHFTGFVVGKEYSLVVNIINCSNYKERMNVLPLNSTVFQLDYKLSGSLASGLSQKIIVKFKPMEYKYFYDCIRIRGKEDELLIPLHAYPILNVIDFPRNLSFGNNPLCETITKKITLKCSIPVDFYFELDIVKPHPYFKIYPIRGIIPAHTNLPINITFSPITLGTCSTTIKLNIAQHGFVPIECIISGKAVSGLIEAREMENAEMNVKAHIAFTESQISNKLGTTNFPHNLANSISINAAPETISQRATNKSIAMMLASTYHSNKLESSLSEVVRESKLSEETLKKDIKTAHFKVKGPGSGAIFDPGAQYLTSAINEKRMKMTKRGMSLTKPSTILPPPDEDVIIEGIRIPPNLDNMPGVNFVITQEIGKLKPKDLRAAIERNVADRARRAEEQSKLRSEGGGAGVLDINGILAEERINSGSSGSKDPFKRQLREIAFLADVDEVNKLEIEKGFRVSGEYIGSNILSSVDIEIILSQRKQNALHKAREDWRTDQTRLSTVLYSPLNLHVKAGTDLENSRKISECIAPTFDTNRNDIWSKRLNTLRKFIGLVSKWMARKRLSERMKRIYKTFQDAGCHTKEEVRVYIINENENYKSTGANAETSKLEKQASTTDWKVDHSSSKPTTLATLVCSLPNREMITKITTSIINSTQKCIYSPSMIRRSLFPKFIFDEASMRNPVETVDIINDTNFDDRSYFPLKLRPEYIFMGYEPFKPYTVPVYFPTCKEKEPRSGAPEESLTRPAAHINLSASELLLAATPEESSQIRDRSLYLLDQKEKESTDQNYLFSLENDVDITSPTWLSEPSEWSQQELEAFTPQPDLRVYSSQLRLRDTDDEWSFRPFAAENREKLKYIDDSSLRTKWLKSTGFLSVNMYMLGGSESCSVDPIPPPGPILSETFLQDVDLHTSGLHCFARDHTRSVLDNDPDVAPLQECPDPKDYLTDSDSDDDDVYVPIKPSIQEARRIITTPKISPRNVPDPTPQPAGKGKAAPPGKAPAAPPTPVQAPPTNDTVQTQESFALLDESEKRHDQVELMRDRKILDFEISKKKSREMNAAELSKKLEGISKASTCGIHALPVQMPFHLYEDDVYSLLERSGQF